MLDWKTASVDEKLEVIRPLAEQGASAGEMAKHFANATRNATLSFCIRRKIRLGGSASSGGKALTKQVKAKGQAGQPKVNAIARHAASMPSFPVARPADDEVDLGVDVTKRIGLLDLTERTCKWPVGRETGAKQMFCGCRKGRDGGPYCSHHAAKAEYRR